MAPNLGWRDEPLGARLRDRVRAAASRSQVANDADLGALAECRRGAAVGVDNVLFLAGEVGVGGGMIVDGRTADRRGGLWRRGRPHAGQPGRTRLPLRLHRLLGDRHRRGTAADAARAIRPTAEHPRSTRSCAKPTPAASVREPPWSMSAVAGLRPRRPRQRPQSRADRPWRALRAALSVRRSTGSRRSWIAAPFRRPARWCGSCRRPWARDAAAARRGRARLRTPARRPGRVAGPAGAPGRAGERLSDARASSAGPSIAVSGVLPRPASECTTRHATSGAGIQDRRVVG